MFLLSTLAAILTTSFFWGCNKAEILTIPENMEMQLKNGVIAVTNECTPSTYALLTSNNIQVGQIIVSNDETYLKVEFVGNGSTFSEVQLWVGTNATMVPKNSHSIPVPGKFSYKGSNSDYFVFEINLSDLYFLTPESVCDEKDLSIFAHADIDDSGPKKDSEISAWSEGTSFGTSRHGTYSLYTTCCKPTGGGGCVKHLASAGDKGIFNVSGGKQSIFTDNDEIAGTVEYDGENLIFSFYQDWMFSGTVPLVSVWGLENPDANPVFMTSTNTPEKTLGIYFVPVVSNGFPFFIIEFNLQYCTTEN